jgi:hypothetical protein
MHCSSSAGAAAALAKVSSIGSWCFSQPKPSVQIVHAAIFPFECQQSGDEAQLLPYPL